MLNFEHFTEIQSVINARISNRDQAGCYQFWLRSFLDFHKLGSLRTFGALEATMFLEYLADERGAGVDQLDSAREALNFYYRNVLNKHLTTLQDQEEVQCIVCRKHPKPRLNCDRASPAVKPVIGLFRPYSRH